MDKRDILIRLLKEGHINEEEFKMLYDEPKEIIVKEREVVHDPLPAMEPWRPTPPFNPWFGTPPLFGTFSDNPGLWMGYSE